MKTTLLHTSNAGAKALVGVSMKFSADLKLHLTFDLLDVPEGDRYNFRRGHWTTSAIEQYTVNEVSRNYYEILIKTTNSVYKLGVGTKTDVEPLTAEELLVLQMAMFI